MTQRWSAPGWERHCGDRCIIDGFIFPRFEHQAEKQRLRRLEGDTVWPDSAFATPACSCAAPGAGISASSLCLLQEGAPRQGSTGSILQPRSSRSFGHAHPAESCPWGLEGVRAPEFAFGFADDPKPSSASGDCLRTQGPWAGDRAGSTGCSSSPGTAGSRTKPRWN